MVNDCNTFPSHNPALWKYLEALGKDALAQDYPFQSDTVTGKQRRVITDQEDDTNIHEMLGLPGIHLIQKKHPNSIGSSKKKKSWSGRLK